MLFFHDVTAHRHLVAFQLDEFAIADKDGELIGGGVAKFHVLKIITTDGHVHAVVDDVVFAVRDKGRFDEIPQMVNILKGEMSIVGPRAEWANEVKVFEKEIPFYTFRNFIKAGWTGWSHISMGPCFSVDDERERLAYDLYYIKHRNVFWDFAILVKAVFLACGGRHK